MNCQDQVEAVKKMQDYIDKHLDQPITLYRLANQAGYSPYHSAKIFKEHALVTPFEYIRKLRLSKAALLLREERTKITDVALDFVFDSHEGFTRAFSKEFGITPKAYSQNPRPIPLFMPYLSDHSQKFGNKVRRYQKHNLKIDENRKGKDMKQNENAIFVQIVERPARKLILKRGREATHYFQYCDEVGCDVWGILSDIKEALYEPIGLWLPSLLRPAGTSEYAQGVEVALDYQGIIPEGFEIMDLSPCTMMIFQGPPFEDEKFCEAIEALCIQIEKFNPEIYGYRWNDEIAPRFQLEPQGYRGYIEGRPVSRI